jgi:soluble lytic murein transglycosylase-like protein
MVKQIITALVLWMLTSLACAFDVEYITQTTCRGSVTRPAKACIKASVAQIIVERVQYYSALYSVSERLVWRVMQVESSFNPKARSRTGARGLMQIMPYWHKDKIEGRQIDDIDTNIDVGVQILREYMGRYRSEPRALQAYVGSPNTTRYTRAVYAVKHTYYSSVHPLGEDRLPLTPEHTPYIAQIDARYTSDVCDCLLQI